MRVQFYIRFYTKPGENLFITGNAEALGGNNPATPILLTYLNNQFWYGSFDIDSSLIAHIRYSYIFQTADGEFVQDGCKDRVIDISKTGLEEIEVIDTWNNPGEYENVFNTSPFTEVLLQDRKTAVKTKSAKNFTHLFKVKAPLLNKHEVICLLGHSATLGDWNTDTPILLNKEDKWWTLKINLSKDAIPLTYKYGVYNIKEESFVTYEVGENRFIQSNSHQKKICVIHDGFVRLSNNTWKGAGVSIPVFSLRSKDGFGVGEFNDLKLLVDWTHKTGLKMIQLLPVNDTISSKTYTDSYPYSAISAFALHPIYINLATIAGKEDMAIVKSLAKKQKQLNALDDVDYEQVIKFKLAILRELFLSQKEKFLADEGFRSFFAENKEWLIPYAAFCYLRDRNGTADFSKWKLYSTYDKSAIEKYVSPRAKHYNEIALIYFIQYHLHLQLKAAVGYAHKNGVIIKGDIPIGVSPKSCETWTAPELFHMDLQCGAPPDDFAIKGQNWGFPTYNWEQMSKDHFAWWHKRFSHMAKYFDAFRIDHILGFFRIWNIPVHAVEGIMGFFTPSIPIHIYEFGQRGMWFNYHRFCKPYITETVLWELFGPNKEKFLPFLIYTGNHHYILKEEFSTQREVETHFQALDNNAENLHIKKGLFELIANVILFEVGHSGGQQFHFRIDMDKTTSFNHLDENIQHQLRAMYIDYFYHRQEEGWRVEAQKKLPTLKRSTNMLVCGEDLGMVPKAVPEVMKTLGILSLEVQRMPKDSHKDFSNPADAPYLSVVTPSTHDMSTIRSWWEEDLSITQKFFNHELGQMGEAPQICESGISKAIIKQHLLSPAMWSVFQLQDLLGMDEHIRKEDHSLERINVPAINNHYWKYRMHIYLEDLLDEDDFNKGLKKNIELSNR